MISEDKRVRNASRGLNGAVWPCGSRMVHWVGTLIDRKRADWLVPNPRHYNGIPSVIHKLKPFYPPYLLCRAQYPPASRPRDTFSCIFSPDGSSDSCFFRCIYNADGSLNQDNDAACPVPAPFGVRPSRMKARKFTNDPAPPQPGEAPADSLRRQVNEWRQRDELLRRRPADVKEARAAIKREVGGRDDS
ncbi:hypothetical protein RQP46_011142 [Phenoliferia psychrophenolica]